MVRVCVRDAGKSERRGRGKGVKRQPPTFSWRCSRANLLLKSLSLPPYVYSVLGLIHGWVTEWFGCDNTPNELICDFLLLLPWLCVRGCYMMSSPGDVAIFPRYKEDEEEECNSLVRQ